MADIHRFVTADHGALVMGNVRWIETSNSRPLRAYIKSQNACTRQILDSLPGRAARLKEIAAGDNPRSEPTLPSSLMGAYFFLQFRPGQNRPKHDKRDALTGATQLRVDTNSFAKAGTPVAIDWGCWLPSIAVILLICRGRSVSRVNDPPPHYPVSYGSRKIRMIADQHSEQLFSTPVSNFGLC